MSNLLKDTLRTALANLRVEYGLELPREFSDLERAVDKANRMPFDLAAVRHARLRAHTIKGTAGSYGFARVSAAAGQAEQIIERIEKQGLPTTDPAWSDLALAMAELPAALASDLEVT